MKDRNYTQLNQKRKGKLEDVSFKILGLWARRTSWALFWVFTEVIPFNSQLYDVQFIIPILQIRKRRKLEVQLYWLFEDWDSLTTTIYWKLIVSLIICFICNIHFIPCSHPARKVFYYPHFVDEKTKASSHIRWVEIDPLMAQNQFKSWISYCLVWWYVLFLVLRRLKTNKGHHLLTSKTALSTRRPNGKLGHTSMTQRGKERGATYLYLNFCLTYVIWAAFQQRWE